MNLSILIKRLAGDLHQSFQSNFKWLWHVSRITSWCVFIFPLFIHRMVHHTLTNENTKSRRERDSAYNRKRRRESLTILYFYSSQMSVVFFCRNECIDVCKLSFHVWCKCENVMCFIYTGWRLVKYMALRDCEETFMSWMSWKSE